jgi:hypothetical protein
MKLLIGCDEVFDILTRGPFPTGNDSDAAVEHHLRCCHDCRQLAEALRPAVALFHECLSDDEVRSLPEYHGAVQPLGDVQVRRLPQDITELQLPQDVLGVAPGLSVRGPRSQSERRTLLMQGFAAIVVSAAVILLVVSFGNALRDLRRSSTAPGSGPWETTAASPFTSQEKARLLLGLKLPAACWLGSDLQVQGTGGFEQQLALALERYEVACCTRCHADNAGHSQLPPLHQVATLQKSCLICHKG